MANTLLTIDMITNEALRVLHEQINFIGNINREYDDSFAQKGAKIGDTLRVRKPAQYTVRSGASLSAQDTVETSVALPITNQKGVDITFTTAEMALSLDEFSQRILVPAMSTLAANVEADAFTMYKDVWNVAGSVGSALDFADILAGRTKMNQGLSPKDNSRCVTLRSESSAGLVDELKGLFQDSSQVSKQYLEGMMGRTAGFNFYENESAPTHLNGADVTGVTVNGAGQTGSSITLAAFANLNKGDVFTIANVNRVHPETKTSMGVLQQFTVTADVAAAGAVAISPSIVTSGAQQTVDAGPADGAACTFVGGDAALISTDLCYHKDAFTFATADLMLPRGVDMASRKNFEGLSMRIVRQYDISTDAMPCRIDLLYGFGCIRPELASRLVS